MTDVGWSVTSLWLLWRPGPPARREAVPVNLFVAGVVSGLSALGYLLTRDDG